MTYKQIETSREIRLWIGQVIIPVAMVTTMALTNKEVKNTMSNTFKKTKRFINRKFRKNEEL